MAHLQDFYENALTPNTMLTSANYDPMSPITEEAAPEFPSKFEESQESNTIGKADQAESTTSVEDNTGIEDVQNDYCETHDEISLPLREEETLLSEVKCKVDSKTTHNLNDWLPEKESKVSKLKMAELVEGASSEDNDGLSNAESTVPSGNCEISLDDTADFSHGHSATDPNLEVLCSSNGDLHDSDEATTKCNESEKCTDTVQKDNLRNLAKDQVHSMKTSTPREDSLIPHLQSNTICAEQSNFTGQSTHSTNLLMEENGLEVAYDRNSVNNGGGMVKIQCEKCPA